MSVLKELRDAMRHVRLAGKLTKAELLLVARLQTKKKGR